VIGGLVLLGSATLLIVVLARSHFGATERSEPLGFAIAVNPPVRVSPTLNGFGLWNAIVLVLMILTYGYPIGQFFYLRPHSVPAIGITSAPDLSAGR
jgi:cytochrome c oxidase subunit 1